MTVIFSFSHFPGSPAYYAPPLSLVMERKGAHVVEYAVLFLLSLQVFSLVFYKESVKKIIYLTFVWCLSYAALDELHQFFTPYRGAHLHDVLIDVIGMVLAFLFVFSLLPIQKKEKTKKT
jgi:VanZ family protein